MSSLNSKDVVLSEQFQQNVLIAKDLVARCKEHGLHLATAESCTAGLIASTVASVAGASCVLRGGAVTYVNEVKHRVLGVSEQSLEQFSAVSEQVACEMAVGAQKLFDADIAVSATGYAGPDGGDCATPVGTVYLGVATAGGVRAYRYLFSGDRQDVREQAVAQALKLVQESF